MQILDLNQTTFSVAFSQLKNIDEVNEDIFRYIVLNCIRSYVSRFRKDYGELIIACDSTENWRKDVFPYYKARRAKSREDSKVDWNKIFKSFNVVREELKEFFPYKVVEVPKAEADDVIAVIAQEASEPVLILSGDTDFMQLHSKNIKQYDVVRKRHISTTIKTYLFEHILEGDVSDGVPNVLSADDTFVLNKRQRPLTKKRKEFFLKNPLEQYSTGEKRNFLRNKQLIDLNCVPEEIKINILEQYKELPVKNKSKLFNYFYDKKLMKFIDSIQEF